MPEPASVAWNANDGAANKDPAFVQRADFKPCAQLELNDMHSWARDFPSPPANIAARTASFSISTPNDPFYPLPGELLQAIVSWLPVSDFLSLRYASRTMAELFNDQYFWRTRLLDRGFMEYLVQGEDPGKDVDFQRLYHIGTRIQNDFETTVKVWEVVRYIKDVLSAAVRLEPIPTPYIGRALQAYHNDTAPHGCRIERVQIPAQLLSIGISFTDAPYRECRQIGKMGPIQIVTYITSLEFEGSGGFRAILGSKNPHREHMIVKTARTAHGNRWPAPNDAFHGFRIAYNADAIYSIVPIPRPERYMPTVPVSGYRPHDEIEFDMNMERDYRGCYDVEGAHIYLFDNRLVDLGVRGHGLRDPFHGFPPADRNFDGRYGKIMKRWDKWNKSRIVNLCVGC
ncbi:hypothetical protein BJX64DRAFT_292275 [Aspergillus heterothallicus]